MVSALALIGFRPPFGSLLELAHRISTPAYEVTLSLGCRSQTSIDLCAGLDALGTRSISLNTAIRCADVLAETRLTGCAWLSDRV
jgi:hypothetical protein